ncbi:GntR family transcriptional regulator [Subtercola boreus]|uniref:HTH gntR-type domain-containing protein n=1 Tax=Subtercola boreus TaxID=120213 RepID=A0A3E0W997_9MICO|nr:GntR family transcriptional regulator [Subtercola boreus]RFA18822.1 hypothetical protein B7R24_13880 [Subtercola boreus]RFA18936.1 hypothetical protein B7R23_13870 [Subtercola boreus]RFA25474.1 hypothetical protein B7R25_13980 [Subtercola boreus]
MVKYESVLKDLSVSIATMRPGDQLPTERQLAAQYGVSNMTVRRALDVLSSSKRIVGIRGRGTFVAQPTVTKQMTLASFTSSMLEAGMTARAQVLAMELKPADDKAREMLGLDEGAQIITIDRLRFGDDTPLCIDRSMLPAERFPGLLGNDLSGSLYEVLYRRYNVELSRAESRVSAVLPSHEDAQLLRIPLTTPCLRVISQGSTIDEAVVENTVSLYRGDLYELLIGRN